MGRAMGRVAMASSSRSSQARHCSSVSPLFLFAAGEFQEPPEVSLSVRWPARPFRPGETMAMAVSTPSMCGGILRRKGGFPRVAGAAAQQSAQVARNGAGGARGSNLHTAGSSGKAVAMEIA